jgi:hypothetical protein
MHCSVFQLSKLSGIRYLSVLIPLLFRIWKLSCMLSLHDVIIIPIYFCYGTKMLSKQVHLTG